MISGGMILSGNTPVAKVECGHVRPILPERMPLYLARGGDLEYWFEGRAIDRHRPNSRLLKKVLRLADTEDVSTVLRVHAATITDDYWFRTEDEPDLTWDQVRFSENCFAEIALTGSANSMDRRYTPAQLRSATPELTNTGSFEKCWKLESGSWYLYKQGTALEYFSELFVSRLGAAFGISSAQYMEADGYVKTKDFTEGRYNFEPAAALVGENDDYIFNYDRIEALKPGLGRAYADLMYMDALCFNMDRHTNNYGFLRDREAGEILSMAPNFDNNIALISRGYVENPTQSNELLIDLFLELLRERQISFTPPALDAKFVQELVSTTLPNEDIDRGYVSTLIQSRRQQIVAGIQKLTMTGDMRLI